MPGGKLRVLVAEDTADDFDLLMRALRRGGYEVEARRVDTAEDFHAALHAQPWDIVFSDWAMPSFTAPDALAIVHASHLDLPFIIVSGTVGEEAAVEALRNGAHDFLIKTRLTRLPVVVDRELRDAASRRERGRMQEQLMISDRMASVGILAAGVAHEINNPLAAVLANLDMALADLDAMPGVDDAGRVNLRDELSDARSAAERVRHIVRDLRIFSRSEDERRGRVDAEKVMESTLRMASNEIRHRARLVRDYQRGLPPLDASEARLGQVFLNLVVNAAQALPDGRADKNEIRVSIHRDGARARIEIADTGPGIPPDVMTRLFTPFVTTKPAGVGTGLGLSICHRIVTSLGGEIKVDTRLGGGTRFTVWLPFAASDDDVATTLPIPLRHATRRGRVLIVDDEPMIARAVQRALAVDHELHAVLRGAEALALIERGERFDVIVCDLMMPEMTGIDVHDAIAAIAPDQARSIIFLTGGAFTPRAREFLDRTDNPHIEKPFDPAFLRALINDRVR